MQRVLPWLLVPLGAYGVYRFLKFHWEHDYDITEFPMTWSKDGDPKALPWSCTTYVIRIFSGPGRAHVTRDVAQMCAQGAEANPPIRAVCTHCLAMDVDGGILVRE